MRSTVTATARRAQCGCRSVCRRRIGMVISLEIMMQVVVIVQSGGRVRWRLRTRPQFATRSPRAATAAVVVCTKDTANTHLRNSEPNGVLRGVVGVVGHGVVVVLRMQVVVGPTLHPSDGSPVTRLGHSALHVVQTVTPAHVCYYIHGRGAGTHPATVTIRMHIQGI